MTQGNKSEHLSKEERFCIEKMKKAGFSSEDIARTLERGKSTIDEELRRNGGRDAYHYEVAHRRAYLRQYRKKRSCLKVALEVGIRKQVEHYLYTYQWSPETISATLRISHRLRVSAKAIYKYIRTRCLDYLLAHYRRRRRGYIRTPLTDRIFIDDPRCTREGYGHWEGDFIVSSKSAAALLILTERLTKETKICHLPHRENDLVNQTIVSMLAGRTVASITVDNDVAFIKHRALSGSISAPVYFARPYRSTDKALVENTNRWIRRFVPKRTDLAAVSSVQIKKALHWLNERPRECLGWMSATMCAVQQEELLKFS